MAQVTEVAANTPYALDMRGVTKRFPGTLAVDNVSFSVKVGEVHALVGENGAGKSTLMKMIAGSFHDYEGDIYINGQKADLHTPALAKEKGVGMIYQELSLARPISIMENLLVGRLPKKGNSPFIDKQEALKQAKALLLRVGLHGLDPRTPISEISQCDAQLVEIAKVLGNNPSILVMDEPTSALSSEEVNRLFNIIGQLKSEGISIIYISHHLQEIFRVCDRVTVMRDGKKIASSEIADTTPEQLIEQMVGRSVAAFYAERQSKIGKEVRFAAQDISRWGFFHHISFEVHAGEILGISGLAGAGRSELARSIVGIDPLDDGHLFLDGKEVRFDSMGSAIDNGVAYLTENRKVDGLALRLTVAENTLSTIVPRLSSGLLYNPASGKQNVMDLIDELSIYPPEPHRPVANLSGGNQQKVLMAKWLATKPAVLILDEPTRGVDIGAKEIIHKAVQNLASEGSAVILITSDLPEMVGLSDRALIMRNGHIIGEIEKDEMSENALLLAANGEGRHIS